MHLHTLKKRSRSRIVALNGVGPQSTSSFAAAAKSDCGAGVGTCADSTSASVELGSSRDCWKG
jgi:hypothetical protein